MLKFACVAALATPFLLAQDTEQNPYGLTRGTPDITFAGALAFGPDGILFVADPRGAAVFAIDTEDTKGKPADVQLDVENITGKIAGLLGTTAQEILINDLAVNPKTGSAYLSVARGRGPDAEPVIVRVNGESELEAFPLEDVKFSKAELANAPAPGGEGRRNRRVQSITDLLFVGGELFVAGLSNEEFASKLRALEFPFATVGGGLSVEIYHGAHGAWETRAPIRTFVQYQIAGAPHILAAYTCTPLVKFSLSEVKASKERKFIGTTVAELGSGNQPLDMFVYSKDGKDYILIANSRRGVMKVTTENIAGIEGSSLLITRAGLIIMTHDVLSQT